MIPDVYLFSEVHVRLQLFCRSSAFFLQLFESFDTLALGMSEYAFGLWVAFIVIAYDDSAFPSTILAMAYRAFAIFAFLICLSLIPFS